MNVHSHKGCSAARQYLAGLIRNFAHVRVIAAVNLPFLRGDRHRLAQRNGPQIFNFHVASERQQIANVAQERPRIDLEIKFDYNSANIAKTALADMDNLGKALTDSSLKGSTFVLAGHTDAVGSEEYNLDLSSRRADSVKRYLMEKYSLAPDHLVTAGYGKTRLKNKDNPKAAENRSVEVVNMADR